MPSLRAEPALAVQGWSGAAHLGWLQARCAGPKALSRMCWVHAFCVGQTLCHGDGAAGCWPRSSAAAVPESSCMRSLPIGWPSPACAGDGRPCMRVCSPRQLPCMRCRHFASGLTGSPYLLQGLHEAHRGLGMATGAHACVCHARHDTPASCAGSGCCLAVLVAPRFPWECRSSPGLITRASRLISALAGDAMLQAVGMERCLAALWLLCLAV